MGEENIHEMEEQEVLNGVSLLQQELELERSLNLGLASKFEELKEQYDSDNEVTTELRKRIVQLENQLLEGLSESNKKREGEEAVMTRLRKMLEKSETARHQSEYSLLVEQKRCRELKDELLERDSKFGEETQKYKDLLKDCQQRAKEWEKAVKLAEKAAEMEKENMEVHIDKLAEAVAEKDGLIEFLSLETEEKKTQIDETSKALDDIKKENNKAKEELSNREQVIKSMKEHHKQVLLKLAVFEQKEKKHQQDVKDMTEEHRRIENQLQVERGLNIQNTQSFTKLEEEMLKSEKVSKDLELVLEQERKLRKTAEAELSKRSSENRDFQEKIGALEDEIKRLKEAESVLIKEYESKLGKSEERTESLLAEISQHQTICSDLANELKCLQSDMDKMEDQYSRSIMSLERLYGLHFTKLPTATPLEMVTQVAEKLNKLENEALNQKAELETLKRDVKQNESTLDTQKKSLQSKSETISNLNKQIGDSREEVGRLEQEACSLRSNNKALQQEIQDITALLATEQEKALTLLTDKKEIIKQKHDNLKDHCDTVRHIGETLGEKIRESEWEEICKSTLTAAQRVVSENKELNVLLKEAQEEIKSCHVSMEALSKAVDSARVESSRKLAESETVHSDHTKALEANYLKLIDTLNSKLKSSEVNTYETNDKIKAFYQENEDLKEQIHSLEEDLLTCEQRRVNFQAAVGILGSNILHHMNSYNRVLHVLSFYKYQVSRKELQSEQLSSLSNVLRENSTNRHPVYSFRRCVITVLAANRLKVLGKEHKDNYVLGAPPGGNPVTWLESRALDDLVTKSLRHWRGKPLSITADKLISSIYNNTNSSPAELYPGSLLHAIARGQKNMKHSYNLPNPVTNVREFVLGLTQRLHSVEVERRSLIGKVNHWQKEAKELRGAVEQTAILSRKVEELESVAFETVPIVKHEGVLKELASVMSKEESLREEAHALKVHLRRLEDDYESVTAQLDEKSDTLDEAIKDLSNQKVHQRQMEQRERHQIRTITGLEQERKGLLDQLQTAQQCADSRTCEAQVLLRYLSKLEVALQERKVRVTSGNLSSTTGYLSVDASGLTQPIEEVQKICSLYEDILKLTHRRVNGLERDLQSAKSHTDSLKGELSAACQRIALEDIPLGKPMVGTVSKRNDGLVALKSDSQVRELGAMVGQNFSDVIDSVMSWS